MRRLSDASVRTAMEDDNSNTTRLKLARSLLGNAGRVSKFSNNNYNRLYEDRSMEAATRARLDEKKKIEKEKERAEKMQAFVRKQREELEKKKLEIEKRRKRKIARRLRAIANRSAARVLQRCVIRFLKKVRCVRAATCIQSARRGIGVRREFLLRRDSAILIQSSWRGFLSRCHVTAIRHAIRCVQNSWRRVLVLRRKESASRFLRIVLDQYVHVHRFRKFRYAAICFQRVWRGHSSRLSMAKFRRRAKRRLRKMKKQAKKRRKKMEKKQKKLTALVEPPRPRSQKRPLTGVSFGTTVTLDDDTVVDEMMNEDSLSSCASPTSSSIVGVVRVDSESGVELVEDKVESVEDKVEVSHGQTEFSNEIIEQPVEKLEQYKKRVDVSKHTASERNVLEMKVETNAVMMSSNIEKTNHKKITDAIVNATRAAWHSAIDAILYVNKISLLERTSSSSSYLDIFEADDTKALKHMFASLSEDAVESIVRRKRLVHVAASMNALKCLEILLDRVPSDMTSEDECRQFPVHRAVASGAVACTILLTRALNAKRWAKLALFQTDLNFATCLHLALLRDVCEDLIELPDVLLTLILSFATTNDVLEMPLKHTGLRPLHLACCRGRTGCVLQLLAAGADPSKGTNNLERMTPLMYACKEGHHDVAMLLLRSSVDVNAQREDGMTASHLAMCNGHVELGRYLVSNWNADTTLCDKDGFTVLDWERRMCADVFRGDTKVEVVVDEDDEDVFVIDENVIAVDKNNVVVDKNDVVVDKNNVVVDKNNVVVDENNVVVDENNVVVDENNIALDENNIALDENTNIVVDETTNTVVDNHDIKNIITKKEKTDRKKKSEQQIILEEIMENRGETAALEMLKSRNPTPLQVSKLLLKLAERRRNDAVFRKEQKTRQLVEAVVEAVSESVIDEVAESLRRIVIQEFVETSMYEKKQKESEERRLLVKRARRRRRRKKRAERRKRKLLRRKKLGDKYVSSSEEDESTDSSISTSSEEDSDDEDGLSKRWQSSIPGRPANKADLVPRPMTANIRALQELRALKEKQRREWRSRKRPDLSEAKRKTESLQRQREVQEEAKRNARKIALRKQRRLEAAEKAARIRVYRARQKRKEEKKREKERLRKEKEKMELVRQQKERDERLRRHHARLRKEREEQKKQQEQQKQREQDAVEVLTQARELEDKERKLQFERMKREKEEKDRELELQLTMDKVKRLRRLRQKAKAYDKRMKEKCRLRRERELLRQEREHRKREALLEQMKQSKKRAEEGRKAALARVKIRAAIQRKKIEEVFVADSDVPSTESDVWDSKTSRANLELKRGIMREFKLGLSRVVHEDVVDVSVKKKKKKKKHGKCVKSEKKKKRRRKKKKKHVEEDPIAQARAALKSLEQRNAVPVVSTTTTSPSFLDHAESSSLIQTLMDRSRVPSLPSTFYNKSSQDEDTRLRLIQKLEDEERTLHALESRVTSANRRVSQVLVRMSDNVVEKKEMNDVDESIEDEHVDENVEDENAESAQDEEDYSDEFSDDFDDESEEEESDDASENDEEDNKNGENVPETEASPPKVLENRVIDSENVENKVSDIKNEVVGDKKVENKITQKIAPPTKPSTSSSSSSSSSSVYSFGAYSDDSDVSESSDDELIRDLLFVTK